MEYTYIKDIGQHTGQEVELRGWLYNKRSSGKIQFLLVRDGTGIIQGVMVKNEVAPEVFEPRRDLPKSRPSKCGALCGRMNGLLAVMSSR